MHKPSLYRKVDYDVELINSIIERIKNEGLRPEDWTICFDMDNTLAIFSYFGNDDEALKKANRKGFYRNLQCFEEAPAVVETLQKIGFKVKILSVYLDTKYCKDEKIAWIEYHLPTVEKEDIILVPKGDKKTDYIEDIKHTILVDDYYGNLITWMEEGGLAIKKTFSGKPRPIPQVINLTEIFKILYDLGLLNNN